MELEVIVGTYECSIIGYSIDLLSQEKPLLRKKYYERDHVGSVRCVATGGHYLASGGSDEIIKLYNMRKHTELGSLLHHQGTITALTFYKNTHLLSCSEDGLICIWKCGRNWECLHTLTGHKHPVSSVSIHPSGRLAISVGKDRSVRTWNLLTGRPAFTIRLPRAADLVQWNPIGSQYTLAVGSTLMVYDLETAEPSTCVEVGKAVNAMLYIKEDVLAVGSDQPGILIYSTTSGRKLASLEGHTNRVKGLALSPDQTLLFSASSDGYIKAWALSDPLQESCDCVCSVSTGCRVTCITTLLIEHNMDLSHTDEQKTDTTGKLEGSGGHVDEEEGNEKREKQEVEKAIPDTNRDEEEEDHVEDVIAQGKKLAKKKRKVLLSGKRVAKSQQSSEEPRKRTRESFRKTKSKTNKL